MSLIIHGTRTIAADQTLTFTNETGIFMEQQGFQKPVQLFNYGSIQVTSDMDESAAIGIMANVSAPDSIFWNEAGGSFSVTATAAAGGYAYGVYSQGHLDIRNDGAFDVVATGGATGVSPGGSDVDFTNTGHFLVQAVDEAVGVGGTSTFNNSGTFEVEATSGRAMGIYGGRPSQPGINSGEMTVIDHDGVLDGAAVSFEPQFGPATFLNSGSITASDYSFKELEGGIYTGDARQWITNTGTVRGAIDLGAADDQLHNSGGIRGDIYLRSGDDLYDGGGKHVGALYGGSGDDILTGGKGADHIFGDNAGRVPSDGNDIIDGGAGADVLSGGGGDDSFVFQRANDTWADHADLIVDLETGDVVDLSSIDADIGKKGNQAFHLVSALDGHAGEALLIYDGAAAETRLELDTDGDGQADAMVRLTGDHSDFTNFLL